MHCAGCTSLCHRIWRGQGTEETPMLNEGQIDTVNWHYGPKKVIGSRGGGGGGGGRGASGEDNREEVGWMGEGGGGRGGAGGA